MWSTLLSVAVFAAVNPVSVSAQGDLSAANNVTDLEGTWSSNVAVSTGNVSLAQFLDLACAMVADMAYRFRDLNGMTVYTVRSLYTYSAEIR
jgi:hypothetical protein